MTGGNLQIAYIFIGVASFFVAAIILTILTAKGIRSIRQREWKQAERKLEPYFTKLKEQISHDEPLAMPDKQVNRVEWRVIQDRLMEWITRIGGDSQVRLTELCEQFGFVERDLRELRKTRGLKQSAAAYRLGMMKSPRAAEPLLRILEERPFQSSIFIYARALAMCARSADDLERMVKALVRHQRPVQSMLAAILEEADEHVPELIKRLQQSRDPMLRSVAEQYAHPHLPQSRSAGSSSVQQRTIKQVQHQPSSRAI